MKILITLVLLVLPSLVFAAADDCKIVEFEDHYEVVCVGDGTPVPNPSNPSTVTQPDKSTNTSVRQTTPEPVRDAAGNSDATAPSTSASTTPQRNRQGRPSTADLNTAIEARRKLIQELRPK